MGATHTPCAGLERVLHQFPRHGDTCGLETRFTNLMTAKNNPLTIFFGAFKKGEYLLEI